MRDPRDVSRWKVAAAVVGLALGAGTVAACGDDQPETEELAEEQAELDRQMDMALQGDTAEPELRDEAREEPVEGRPPASPPERRPRTTQPPVQRQAPAPRQQPAEEPAPVEEAPAEEEVRTVTAPSGSTLHVVLNQTLSTGESQVGDLWTARVTRPVTGGPDGYTVVIPQEATIRGRVTGVRESGNRGEEAVIQLAVTEITVGAETYPISASVAEANPELRGRSGTGEKAAKIGAGAAAGAILGRVIGGGAKGAVIGGAAGAAAGTAITLGTEDVDAVLPAGSEMTLRLDRPFTIRLPAL